MPSEALQKSRSRITAQAGGTALTADEDPNSGSYTGGAATTIDNTYDAGTENAKGADRLNLELDVTADPATAAVAEIWYRGSENNSDWTQWKRSHTVGDSILASGTPWYDAGLFYLEYQYTQLKVVALNYAFTAVLYATPKLSEGQ